MLEHIRHLQTVANSLFMLHAQIVATPHVVPRKQRMLMLFEENTKKEEENDSTNEV